MVEKGFKVKVFFMVKDLKVSWSKGFKVFWQKNILRYFYGKGFKVFYVKGLWWKKVFKVLWWKKVFNVLPKETLKVISHSLIYSHVNYCCAVWGNAAQIDVKRLQISLNKAARMILGCGYETGTSQLHSIMGWPTVNERVTQQSIALISKIIKNNKPVCIKNKLISVRDKHKVNTRLRHKDHYVLPKIQTVMGSRSFIFRAVKLWNAPSQS